MGRRRRGETDSDPGGDSGTVTDLLHAWRAGGPEAADQLFESVYASLRGIAANQLRASGDQARIGVTELVHETFLRLLRQRHVPWQNRSHFFSIASRLARRAIVDAARERKAQKRGGQAVRVHFEDQAVETPVSPPDLLSLDQALERLEEIDPVAVRIVELRFFVGLTIEQSAEALSVGRTSAVAKWRAARAWLRRELSRES